MGKWYQSRDRRYGKNISINDRPWYYVDFFLFVDFDFQNKEMDRIVHVGVEYRPSEYEKLFLFIDFKIWTFVI